MWNRRKKLAQVKKQRDRFIAFAFASADLFIEIAPSGKIEFLTGAPRSLTGSDDQKLIGTNWLELFDSKSQSSANEFKNKASAGKRCGPTIIDLNSRMNTRKAIISGFQMPNSKNFYIALSLSDEITEKLAQIIEDTPEPITTDFNAEEEIDTVVTTDFKSELEKVYTTTDFEPEEEDQEALTTDYAAEDDKEEAITTDFDASEPEADSLTTGFIAEDDDGPKDLERPADLTPETLEPAEALTTGFVAEDEEFDDSIYNASEFVEEAEKTFDFARENEIKPSLTVFDFKTSLSTHDESWAEMIADIAKRLRQESIDGKAAAQISDKQFSLLHEDSKTAQSLEDALNEIFDTHHPDGHDIQIRSKTIKTNTGTLDGHEASRALYHAIKKFEEDGTDFEFGGLNDGFKSLVTDNTKRLKEFKSIIERVDFDIHFQPIVNLKTKEADHYEVLTRVQNGDIADWVKFGEDAGVIADFDLAVIERAINYIHYKAIATRFKLAVNISSKSIETPEFYEKLLELLSKREIKDKVFIEIIESCRVRDFDLTKGFIQDLQNEGYTVILDDFLLEPEALERLAELDVSYVKLNDKYIRSLSENIKNQQLIENAAHACKKFNTKIIAKHVENDEIAQILSDLGVGLSQGFSHGKAERGPNYVSP